MLLCLPSRQAKAFKNPVFNIKSRDFTVLQIKLDSF